LEAKGDQPEAKDAGLKSKLRNALQQCASGNQILQANGARGRIGTTFGSVTQFSQAAANWESTISFADPDETKEEYFPDPFPLLRYYYSAWFSMLFRPDIFIPLFQNRPPDSEALTDTLELNNQTYFLIPTGYPPGFPGRFLWRYGFPWIKQGSQFRNAYGGS
jgi:hypothetical protein